MHTLCHLTHHLLAHAVEQKVRSTIYKDRWHKGVFPVVVVRHTTKRSLNATNKHWCIGKEALENLCIGCNGIVGAKTCRTASRIGIVAPQADICRIVVYH